MFVKVTSGYLFARLTSAPTALQLDFNYSIDVPPETTCVNIEPILSIYPARTFEGAWYTDTPMIYHAGGGINGNVYTNSREAVEQTLSEGNHFIEIDFQYTSDGHLVCAHKWQDIYLEDRPLTLEEFQSQKIQGRYTPLTARDLIQIMRENPEMYLVTDIKDDFSSVITELVALAENDTSVLDRFIIQLYTGREKSFILDIYPFADSQFLFTLYRFGGWQPEVVQICNEENIAVITASEGSIPDEHVAMLRKFGFTIYEHTVNRVDSAKHGLERGISGFYTDTLNFSDLTS